jgi:biotin carboxyl carrier protein
MKQLRVTVQGKVYEVTVEPLEAGNSGSDIQQAPVSAAVAPVESSAQTAIAPAVEGAVTSPLAGKVVSIQVTAGQAVKQGDQLVVLEAMKMNTYIYAPQDGTVDEILTNVGDAVSEGQALVKIS